MSTASLLLKLLALAGAVVSGLALAVPFYRHGGGKGWYFVGDSHYLVLGGLAVAGLGLFLAMIVGRSTLNGLALSGGGIASAVYAVLLINVDVPASAYGAGAYMGVAGGAVLLVTALIDTFLPARVRVARVAPVTPPPVTAASLPPAGWYPDPLGRAARRYWSGAAWTHETQE